MLKMGINFEDYNEDDDGHEWANICQHCVDKFKVDKNLLDDAGASDKESLHPEDETLCSVEGCQNLSDYYIDFPDGKGDEE